MDMEIGLDEEFAEGEIEGGQKGDEEEEEVDKKGADEGGGEKATEEAKNSNNSRESEQRHHKLVEGIAAGKFVTFKYIGERDGIPLGPKVSTN